MGFIFPTYKPTCLTYGLICRTHGPICRTHDAHWGILSYTRHILTYGIAEMEGVRIDIHHTYRPELKSTI